MFPNSLCNIPSDYVFVRFSNRLHKQANYTIIFLFNFYFWGNSQSFAYSGRPFKHKQVDIIPDLHPCIDPGWKNVT